MICFILCTLNEKVIKFFKIPLINFCSTHMIPWMTKLINLGTILVLWLTFL
jgi:hypothetical protein